MNIEVDRLSSGNAHFNEFLFSDVIGRSEVQLLTDIDLQLSFGKSRVLIIGAGGSIGSALATRLATAELEQIFFLDRDESALHGLALALSNTAASHSDKCFIADIRDIQSINDVLRIVQPTIVIHAAALKHLVILERFPREGYLTNIMGTLNVAEACLKHGVEQFVNISTDKAANPISVLGKTKKIAELLTEEVFADADSQQCSVRFGNVFASRGSVIETFIHQIRHGLPVTITDKNVARFFMSRNEAANLVLAAASLKVSGTYIQNMGEEVAIVDVVNKIAQYLSLVPIIRFIGLQNGEKLHEELYDGPTVETRYDSISRSTHQVTPGLVEEIKLANPASNTDAIEQIDQLIQKYLKK